MANEALQIANIEFAVTSQIGRAPHWTMIRELTMNAIEAAEKSTGEKLVHWTTGTYKGVRSHATSTTLAGSKRASASVGMSTAEAKLFASCEARSRLRSDASSTGGGGIASQVRRWKSSYARSKCRSPITWWRLISTASRSQTRQAPAATPSIAST